MSGRSWVWDLTPRDTVLGGEEDALTGIAGSLCCENADEAKTLIPSLADKISDEDLQDLLDEISKLQNR